jgi:hypothetical protein
MFMGGGAKWLIRIVYQVNGGLAAGVEYYSVKE